MRKARSIPVLVFFLVLVLATSGCGEKEDAGTDEVGAGVPKNGKVTVAQAYQACKSEIEKMEVSGDKLSMIKGRMVDENGLAETWDFTLPGPSTGADSIMENHVAWERGEVKSWSYGE